MTENLLQKLEEKVMLLMTENASLKAEKNKYMKRLHELLALLDSSEGEEIEELMTMHEQQPIRQEEYGRA